MLPTSIRRLPAATRWLRAPQQPYQPKKVWPPDFSKLSPKEQFKFEKKYKRRVALASARPRWNKIIRLTQLFTVTFVVVYSVLFMDWKGEHQPFEPLRRRFWALFSPTTLPSSTTSSRPSPSQAEPQQNL